MFGPGGKVNMSNFPAAFGQQENNAALWSANRKKSLKLNLNDSESADDNYLLAGDVPNSDQGAIENQVKRTNLLELFLRGTDMDNYLASHMYGRKTYVKRKADGRQIATGEATLLEKDIRQLHDFTNSIYVDEDDEDIVESKAPKMGAFATYIALIKGYCALMILVLPKSFKNGGWAFSAGVMIVSASV